MLRSTRAVAGALALALCWFGVAACGDDDPDTDRPSAGTTTAAATPTEPSATASASETAEAMTPVQTVRAWVEAYNELHLTGDSTELDSLTAPRCMTCRNLADSLSDTYAAGGSYRGGSWEIAGIGVAGREGAVATVDVAIDAPMGEIKRRAGAPFESYASDKFILEFTVDTRTTNAPVVDLVTLS